MMNEKGMPKRSGEIQQWRICSILDVHTYILITSLVYCVPTFHFIYICNVNMSMCTILSANQHKIVLLN